MVKPKEIRPGFKTSIDASYTVDEIKSIFDQYKLKNCNVTKNFMGIEITGEK
ncbi:hypothetical protein GF312_04025 [Candidatus Poribacteria bacterium]|nr:hypothetical protein [Candidatus Poribacteria bacterium]